VFCYPNAGLPNAMGGYDQKGEEMAEEIRPFCEENLVNAIGGCCGSTPDHIAAIAKMASAYPPRPVHDVEPLMRISGLEPLNYQPNASNMRSTFLNLGERCNVAGSTLFKKAIVNNDYDKALAIALKQVQQGAHVLDINMDDGLIDGVAAMTKFVNLCVSGVLHCLLGCLVLHFDTTGWLPQTDHRVQRLAGPCTGVSLVAGTACSQPGHVPLILSC
jgi:5-methyltetrahydrofolate--homocysteine methyltransferase